MINEKKLVRTIGILFLIILIFVLINLQKGWIEYAVNQRGYSVVKATIIDEIDSTFRRDVVLRYEKDMKIQEEIVAADIRDSLDEEISIAIGENGEVLRTTLFLPADFGKCYSIIGIIIVIIVCCFGYKSENKNDGAMRTYEEHVKEEKKREWVADMEKTELQIKLVVGIIALIAIILHRIFL